MKFFRTHWYDLGGSAGIIILLLLSIFHRNLSDYQLLMYFSLVSLLFHQAEEYRVVATFPGMVNRVMFNSELPDRYPLNTNTSLIVNVWIGWSIYVAAIMAGQQAVWLGMASILVSLGNIIAHTFLFNLKGKTFYNAGLATSWLFFAPCVYFFFKLVCENNVATTADYLIGIPLGLLINVVGVFMPIRWLANKDTPFIFRDSQLLLPDRKSAT